MVSGKVLMPFALVTTIAVCLCLSCNENVGSINGVNINFNFKRCPCSNNGNIGSQPVTEPPPVTQPTPITVPTPTTLVTEATPPQPQCKWDIARSSVMPIITKDIFD